MVPGNTVSGPLRSLRNRFRLLEVGLFLPVLVTGILGVAYFKALGSRQRAVEAAGQQIAQRVGDRARALASARGDQAAQSILEPVSRVRPFDADRAFAAMQAATDSLRACGCGPLKEGAYFFVWVPTTGEYLASHEGARVDGARKRVPAVLPPGSDEKFGIWAMGGGIAGQPWLIHYAVVRGVGGTPTVVGFDIGMASLWSGTIVPAVERARHDIFPMLGDPDTAFAAAFVVNDRELERTGPAYPGPSARTSLLGNDYFSLDVTLNPAILPVLLSAATPPSYPLLLGALGASFLASIMALLLLRQLRRTVARREAFVASISHELRTPLTAVLLHAETLTLDRQTPEAKGRAAGAIVRETRRLIGLVENSLTIAGAGRAADPAHPPAAIFLAPVLREALASLEPAVAERRATLVVALDETAVALIDPVSLDRIAINLVENALRYGPAGQTLHVGLARGSGIAALTVEDEGPGVSRAERTSIWSAFERGTAARGAASTGLGLGLAIVKHLTEAAGGTVMTDQAPGGGARFTVSLPSPPGAPPM